MSAPAGWHRQEDGRDRYWDGQQWTEHYRDADARPHASGPAASVTSPSDTQSAGPPAWVRYLGVGFIGVILGSVASGSGADSSGSDTATPATTVTSTVTETVGPATPSAETITIEPTLPAETVTVTAPPAAPVAAFGEGVYVVGEDIEPGRYRTIEAVDNCYWAILIANTNGEDIVANDNVSGGRPTVVIEGGQEFESNRCGDWAKAE